MKGETARYPADSIARVRSIKLRRSNQRSRATHGYLLVRGDRQDARQTWSLRSHLLMTGLLALSGKYSSRYLRRPIKFPKIDPRPSEVVADVDQIISSSGFSFMSLRNNPPVTGIFHIQERMPTSLERQLTSLLVRVQPLPPARKPVSRGYCRG